MLLPDRDLLIYFKEQGYISRIEKQIGLFEYKQKYEEKGFQKEKDDQGNELIIIMIKESLEHIVDKQGNDLLLIKVLGNIIYQKTHILNIRD